MPITASATVSSQADPDPSPAAAARQQALWRRNRRTTLALLLLWFLVSFGIPFFARELSFTVLGWPFSFWMASQGALLVFCLIIGAYARAMDKLDDEADQPG